MTLLKKKSKVHGYGLYTDSSFHKGDIIGEFSVVPATYHTKFTIWVDGKPYRAINILKYSNHSSDPNAEIDFPFMYALCDIEEDEEILWNYGKDFE